MTDKYIRRLESKLSEYLWLIKHKQIAIEKISDDMVILRGRLVFWIILFLTFLNW